MDPLDVLDKLAERGGAAAVPQKLVLAATSTAGDLAEFAAARWHRLTHHGEDLAALLPVDSPVRLRLLAPQHGLLKPTSDEHGEVHLVPPLGKGWGVGLPFNLFQERFKTALTRSGAPSPLAFMVVGALNEMASNVAEHAHSAVPAVAAYVVSDGAWVFTVTDVGCGLLRSLRRGARFATLTSEVEAVQLAVTDGISSTGEPGRGRGFTHVFKALVDRTCTLRFRSAGAAAVWSGRGPTASTLTILPAPPRTGFHVRVGGFLRERA